jgi:hypothetical protein
MISVNLTEMILQLKTDDETRLETRAEELAKSKLEPLVNQEVKIRLTELVKNM